MTRPVIGSAYQPRRFELRTATSYSAMRPVMDVDAEHLQRALLVDANRRARAIKHAKTPQMKAAIVRRVLCDLKTALRLAPRPMGSTE